MHQHEKAHVEALRKALGSAAVKRPTFAFGAAVQSRSAFTATAIKLEDTGVQAYQGQTPFIKSQDVFKAAISIHPVEARHAAWIRNIANQAPAPAAFNPALTQEPGARRRRRHRLHQVGGRTMPNIGPMEILIVAIIALIVLGPKRLPDAGKSLGKGLREFKGAISGRERRRRARARLDPAGREAARGGAGRLAALVRNRTRHSRSRGPGRWGQ